MSEPQPRHKRCSEVMKTIFAAQEDDITCDECYDHIDQYVDMLRAGQDPAQVLPQVKSHLEQCGCCAGEFQALIAILEAEASETSE